MHSQPVTNVSVLPLTLQKLNFSPHLEPLPLWLHTRLDLRQETVIKVSPLSHCTKSFLELTHVLDCLATRACAGNKFRKELKMPFLCSLEPALRCNAFSSMITPILALSRYKTSCFCPPSLTTGYDVKIPIWPKSRMLINIYLSRKTKIKHKYWFERLLN